MKLLMLLVIPEVGIMPADHAKLLHQAAHTLGQFNDRAPEKKIDWNTSKTTRTDIEWA
jgi:hypothetical protein